MRNAMVKVPNERSIAEHRQALRAAIRQLESAELYLAAVIYMDLRDRSVDRVASRLRSDLDGLRRYLVERLDAMHP